MLEALWSVEFIANTQIHGAGVIVLESERIYGGDSQYFYLGKYKTTGDNGDILNAEITVTHYHGIPFSIFGTLQKFTVKLTGKCRPDTFEMQGFLVENPALKLGVRLTNQAKLP